MKLTTMIFDAKPSESDPLAQSGFVGLVWDADKELIEFLSSAPDREVAASVALNVAMQVMASMMPLAAYQTRMDALRDYIDKVHL